MMLERHYALKKQNFTQRGVIYIHDGTPRLVYDRIREEEYETFHGDLYTQKPVR